MPSFYSNRLPDNSSGSKNRPFGLMKDESGRPDAQQIVAMNQAKHHFSHSAPVKMEGGVLRHFKYAQQILKQRARDTENVNLASQSLPGVMEPGIELSEVDSRTLELNNLLSSIDESIELTTITNLTVNELKKVPRLIIYLSASFDDGKLTELIDFIDEIITDIERLYNDSDTSYATNATRVKSFLETLRTYLVEFAPYVNRSAEDKKIVAVQLAKKIFNLKKSKNALLEETFQPSRLDEEEEEEEEEEGLFEEVEGEEEKNRRFAEEYGDERREYAARREEYDRTEEEDRRDEEDADLPPSMEEVARREYAARREEFERLDEEYAAISVATSKNEEYLDQYNYSVRNRSLLEMNRVADKIVNAVSGQGVIGRKAITPKNNVRISLVRLSNLIRKKTGWLPVPTVPKTKYSKYTE